MRIHFLSHSLGVQANIALENVDTVVLAPLLRS